MILCALLNSTNIIMWSKMDGRILAFQERSMCSCELQVLRKEKWIPMITQFLYVFVYLIVLWVMSMVNSTKDHLVDACNTIVLELCYKKSSMHVCVQTVHQLRVNHALVDVNNNITLNFVKYIVIHLEFEHCIQMVKQDLSETRKSNLRPEMQK